MKIRIRAKKRVFIITILLISCSSILFNAGCTATNDKTTDLPVPISPTASTTIHEIISDNLTRENNVELPFLSVSGKSIIDEKGNEVFLRGVNFGGYLSYEGLGFPLKDVTENVLRQELEKRMGKENTALLFNGYKDNFIQKQDFFAVKEIGINFIRLMFNYTCVETGEIEERIAWAKEAGVYVILDMQAAPGAQNTYSHSNHDGTTRLWTEQKNQDEMVRLWEILAAKYKEEPVVAGYEIVNEPWVEDNNQLASLYQRVISAIRSIDPKHIILLNDNQWNTDFSVFNENSFGDNIVYVFHTYAKPEVSFANIEKYRNYSEYKQVPIMCNEYGEMALIEFFEQAEIPHSPMHYKINRNNPETPFYYMPDGHIYGRWVQEIQNKVSDRVEVIQKITSVINDSDLSEESKNILLEIVMEKGTVKEGDLKSLGRESYYEALNVVLSISGIENSYIFDIIAETFSQRTQEAKSELLESLQTKYWQRGSWRF